MPSCIIQSISTRDARFPLPAGAGHATQFTPTQSIAMALTGW